MSSLYFEIDDKCNYFMFSTIEGSIMPEELPALSKAEYEIMKVIWKTQGMTTGEILNTVNAERKKAVKRATIQVQLRRLVAKGWLKTIKRANTFLYMTTCDKEKGFFDIAVDVRDRVLQGSVSRFVRCLFENDKLSGDEIKDLKKLLSETEDE